MKLIKGIAGHTAVCRCSEYFLLLFCACDLCNSCHSDHSFLYFSAFRRNTTILQRFEYIQCKLRYLSFQTQSFQPRYRVAFRSSAKMQKGGRLKIKRPPCDINRFVVNRYSIHAAPRFKEHMLLWERIFRLCIQPHWSFTTPWFSPGRPPLLRRFYHARFQDWTEVS